MGFSEKSKEGEKGQGLANKIALNLFSLAKNTLILSAAILVILLILAAFFPSVLARPSWHVEISESPLYKNSKFSILPQEKLVYLLQNPQGSVLITLQAEHSPTCPGVLLVDATSMQALYLYNKKEDVPASSYSVCIGYDGVERALDGSRLGSNLSFSNISWPYFQPWMLALEDNWSWSANATFVFEPFGQKYPNYIHLKVVGRKNISSREAFVVLASINSSSSPIDFPEFMQTEGEMAIDAQKRVLLMLKAKNATLQLVEASFLQKQ
jgi:hypothetical protein